MTAPRPLVLIDGIDGSGKTRFAERLGSLLGGLGVPFLLFHVDDTRRPVNWADARGECEVYWSDYFDLAALDRRIATEGPPDAVVVVEGIFTLRLAAAAHATLVYLEIPYDEAAARILARDTALGRTPADVRHRIAARYFPAQQRYRTEFDPLARAELTLDNRRPEQPRVLRADWRRVPAVVGDAVRQLVGSGRPG